MVTDQRQVLVEALLGWDDMRPVKRQLANSGDPHKLAELYQHNATFHASIDTLASMLPAMVNGLAEAARRVGEYMKDEMDALLAVPTPTLYALDDQPVRSHRRPDDDCGHEYMTCEVCDEATLGPDDHKCPNPDCSSHVAVDPRTVILVREGQLTRDNRLIQAYATEWEDGPLPVMRDGERVGYLDNVRRDLNGDVLCEVHAVLSIDETVAADLSQVGMPLVADDGQPRTVMTFSKATLAGATIVPISAWAWRAGSAGAVRRMYDNAVVDADDPQWGEDGH